MRRFKLLRHRELSRVNGRDADDQELDGASSEADSLDRPVDEQTLLLDIRNAAIGFLAHREYSAAELTEKLESRGFDRHLSQRAVARLAEDGLQSDRRFAEVYARSRIERGSGPLLLRAELGARGLNEELIDEHAGQPREFWMRRAQQMLEKKFKSSPETRDAWTEQARYLSRKGFPGDLVYAALGSPRF